jgi:hypothetical protein
MAQANRGLKNPVVIGMVAHAIFFLILLSIVVQAARRQPSHVLLFTLVLVPVTVLVIVSAGLTATTLRRRERLRQVALLNPGATVIRTEWSSAVLAPFVVNRELRGVNYRGFAVDISADANGLKFWRSGSRNKIVLIGSAEWSKINGIGVGRAHASLGPRTADTLLIKLDPTPGSGLASEIELLVRDKPARSGVEELLSRRPRGSHS